MAYPPSAQPTTRTDASTATPNAHATDHNNLGAAINDVVAELGTGPKGASADLTARLTALDVTDAGLQASKAPLAADIRATLTAKGSIYAASAASTPAELTIGTDDKVLTADSSAGTGASWQNPRAYENRQTRRTGATYEGVFPHANTDTSLGALTTQILYVVAIALPKGTLVTNITWVSGATALNTATNQWSVLCDASRNQVAISADGTSGAWGANSEKTFVMTSPYTVSASGLFYCGVMVKATTVPTLMCLPSAASTTALGLAPILNGTSSTGLTTPASCPNPIGAITVTANRAYVYVS